MIDLRSDTVTQPTTEMRQRMAAAVVGDDVYYEDPTVQQLQECAAELLGKEAALFTPSGTMANLLALLSHTRAGEEVLLEEDCHIYNHEVGSLGMVGGLIPRLIKGDNGLITIEQLESALRPVDIHYPPTTLLCLENTHNRSGGRVLPQHHVVEVTAAARSRGLKVHLDGARLFNAATAQKTSARQLAAPFDSVMCCLSKGLAAPVGSILAGDGEFIVRARKFRKMLGGGMRQVGHLAAAGLYALQVMTQRLDEDHRRAQQLAHGLAKLPGLSIDGQVETNIILLEVDARCMRADDLIKRWQTKGIRATAIADQTIRLVTHYRITDLDIIAMLKTTEELLQV